MSVEWPCKGRIETTFGVLSVRFLDFDTLSGIQSVELHPPAQSRLLKGGK